MSAPEWTDEQWGELSAEPSEELQPVVMSAPTDAHMLAARTAIMGRARAVEHNVPMMRDVIAGVQVLAEALADRDRLAAEVERLRAREAHLLGDLSWDEATAANPMGGASS